MFFSFCVPRPDLRAGLVTGWPHYAAQLGGHSAII